jgi:quinoprotein glucose dehydrogenase
LEGILSRKTREEVLRQINEGTGLMPAFAGTLRRSAVNDIVNYLETGIDASAAKVGTTPFDLPYRTALFDIFLDHEGYPGVKAPWGTLNAIDLNEGTITWSIPFGEYPALKAAGFTDTGTDNYGGAIVTQNGLLIIAATTYDNKIRAFDKLTGVVLWEGALPAAGNATPSTYMVDGKQYIVIAAGGGKNGAPSGGTYVAFALPVVGDVE